MLDDVFISLCIQLLHLAEQRFIEVASVQLIMSLSTLYLQWIIGNELIFPNRGLRKVI